ncbi:helix-turn-helix domain-containing protein [Naasia lichenicola]|uniref:Helix-turn-helix domain-containing protein n=1 Tax=Naasia lichenicola TaxID=2565933 RepID=A0A4S4FHM3_9MICO|nr:helix-turn-helix domain-containing protein [Naasia lichenicola]THG29294.1 helix-turn-helix domain-containing protein [Naasia lichenicola]
MTGRQSAETGASLPAGPGDGTEDSGIGSDRSGDHPSIDASLDHQHWSPQDAAMMDDSLLGHDATVSVNDVAIALNVSRDTAYKWISTGLVPAHRIGPSWVIFADEVRAWLHTRSNQLIASEISLEVDLLADYPDQLTYRDLMQLLGRSKKTIYSWLENGIIPAYRVESRWVTHKIDLARLLSSSSNQATPQTPALSVVERSAG